MHAYYTSLVSLLVPVESTGIGEVHICILVLLYREVGSYVQY